ncbi:MAG: 3' terminal RNA ribose 2'-O-methyltransferase Hen1 [Candidatus Accumulibacter sp.]|jgi:3' terminal RNA ribose 2'-O-methyltransferase Hen1|nr:3' terminal RNA ribose 2'-O-methyltransferase Hen1 [Accumulibacter sp.]
MLLTISCSGENTPDIGFLLHKNPARPQVFELSYGRAFVFYPEVSDEKTTVALLLEIDPIDLVRGKTGSGAASPGLFDYVNDRPYVSSSFMSVAIAKVFGTAMSGRGDEFQALADAKLDLSATLSMLPCKSDTEMLKRVFEPLGYEVEFERFVADEEFPDWGESRYVNLTIRGRVRLADLLHHIYVLIPVFDRKKHYWIDREEVEKLLRHGEEWLKDHPEKGFITRRYLIKNRSLANLALDRLRAADDEVSEEGEVPLEEAKEERLSLNRQRLGSVIAQIRACGARSVIDLGCGEGHLLSLLLKEPALQKIAGVDVACSVLEKAKERIHYERLSDGQKQKLSIFQGSLTYKDSRFAGYDAACAIEVIEHLELPRLAAFERVLFEFARPRHAIVTTPNREYNDNYPNLGDGLRHSDHRFEWTRREFRDWAGRVGERYRYSVQFSDIGEQDEKLGAPTQMACFSVIEAGEGA